MPVPDENGNPYYDVVFGIDGNLTAVPDPVQSNGSISYTQGWGPYYSQDPTVDPATALFIDRAQTNQMFHDLTQAVQAYQQFGTPAFITSAMNGGTPFSYGQYARVEHGGVVYTSLVAANTDTPPSAKWTTSFGRTILTGNTIFYVATTGNDSTGNGTSGTPWLTLQHAINYIYQNVDSAGFAVTIQLAAGTYNAGGVVTGEIPGGGSLTIQGASTSAIISTTNSDCILATNGAVISVGMLTLTTSVSGDCLAATFGSTIFTSAYLVFGACGTYHIYSHVQSAIVMENNYTISGSAGDHIHCDEASYATIGTITVTLTGTPNFSEDFCVCANISEVSCAATFSGSATGARYAVAENSLIQTSGAGASYFPGNSGGSTATGGLYL